MIIKKRYEKADDKLRKKADSLLKKIGTSLEELNYKIYCTETTCGRCYYDERIITVPLWALGHENKSYWVYYLAHELAHALESADTNIRGNYHGEHFMKWFVKVCPKYLQKYEHEYKPRHAKAAGISKK